MEESRLLEIATKLPQFAIDKQNLVWYNSVIKLRTGQDSAENDEVQTSLLNCLAGMLGLPFSRKE